MRSTFFRPELETASRAELGRRQLERFSTQLDTLWHRNRFYRQKLEQAGLRTPGHIRSAVEFQSLPFTTKSEVAADQLAEPPFGTNLTFALDQYLKLHQTSGTSGGRPIRWLDTAESWAWWAECWGYVYAGASVGPGDRVFFAFSFGPFIGFWSAFQGAASVGAMTVPGGGQDSEQRLQSILDNRASVLVCTPTYALRLAEVARERGVDLAAGPIRVTIHAGEPGASIPSTRKLIEQAWGATCHDHTGMTEMGATGFTCAEQAGVHLIESEFIFEVINPESGVPLSPGQRGELVISNLGRVGMPLLRYRTGDLVELDDEPCPCGRTFARLKGGVLGRADDMVIVRGMNVFPSSIEDIVREFPDVAEFRLELHSDGPMADLRLLIEPLSSVAEQAAGLAAQIGATIQRRLLFRVDCRPVPPGSLPRFELKARRFFRVKSPAG
jgi:phenylacetate-CoA ligase